MNFSEFSLKIETILNVDLPSGSSITGEGHGLARNIKIGRTAFMDEMGVGSELEYKKQCIKDNTITFHAHIGLSSWEATADALAALHDAMRESGHAVDRAGICLDRRIVLPKGHRDNLPS